MLRALYPRQRTTVHHRSSNLLAARRIVGTNDGLIRCVIMVGKQDTGFGSCTSFPAAWVQRVNCAITSTRMLGRALVALTAGLGLATGASASSVPNEGITAVWKVQQVALRFSSFDVMYPCGALQSKIASILQPIVMDQLTKIGIRCYGAGGTMATANILIASPVEATPENLQALTTFDARTQLVARMRSVELPSEQDIPRFAARWSHLHLSRTQGLNLGPADCELIRSIRDQVLPHLAVRVKHSTSVCDGLRRPVLEVEALLPIEAPQPAKDE
jgi:hypothetical protein